MKEFVKRLLLFILPIFIVAIILEVVLRRIPNNYSYKRKYLDANAPYINVLVLGNSHAFYGIDPSYIHGNCFNACCNSQSLDYDWAILHKYSHKLNHLKYIVVPIDYPSLYKNLNNTAEAWRVKDYVIYYGFYRSTNIADYSELTSNKLLNNLQRIINYYYNRSSTDIYCSATGWGTDDNSKNKQDLTSTGEVTAARHTEKNPDCFNENVGVVKAIIDVAKAQHAKVIFYTSPAYKTYVQHLDTSQMNTTVRTMAKIVADCNNSRYYNLLTDTLFTAADYYDADHLNEKGAKKLSLKIDSLILTD